MLPDTLPGFLLLAGVLMYFVSMFRGGLEVGKMKIPKVNRKARRNLKWSGISLFFLGVVLYAVFIGLGTEPPDFFITLP
jgi:hypothetical protein